jgi:hypothetical protein
MEFEINAFVFLKDEGDETKKTRVELGNIKFEAKNQGEANRMAFDLAVPLIPEALKPRAQGVGYEWVKGGAKQKDEAPKATITLPKYGLKEIAPDDTKS